MGRLYVASVLTAIASPQPAEPAEVELKPIVPGVWAAWAKGWDAQQPAPAASTEAKPTSPVTGLQSAGSKA